MGGSIACGLCTSSLFQPEEVRVSDPMQGNLDRLKSFNHKMVLSKNNQEIVKGADIVLIAVKPWLVESVLGELKEVLDYEHQILVSIAATITIQKLRSFLEKEGKVPVIFRLVPNIAVSVKQSATFICTENASPEQTKLIADIFNTLGASYIIPENQVEGATALASCGIAYAFRYIRASSEGGVEMGFNAELAKQIVMQTLTGAVELLRANNSHPEQEIDKVTTPGGLTIKGLNAMEHAGFTSSVIKGLLASK